MDFKPKDPVAVPSWLPIYRCHIWRGVCAFGIAVERGRVRLVLCTAVVKSRESHLEDGLAIGVEVHEPLGPRKEMIAARNANSFVLQPTDTEIMGILTTT